MLDITNIESDRLALVLEPVDVADVLREAADLIRPLATERGVRVLTEGHLEQHLAVDADRKRLQQVLLNLLSNAVKYNRADGTVALTCERDENQLRIAVSDTGIGMDADQLGRLFTPFDRLGAERTDVQGTGLGLALTRGLVEAMGGEIHVSSAPGRGSTFEVILQLADQDRAANPAA